MLLQTNISKKAHYFTTTQSPNKYIVNAKTGVSYPFKFNSFESQTLYHVIDSTAKYDKSGYIRNRKLNYVNETNHLFYDSPEQYKIHHGSNLSTNEILEWHTKQAELKINDSENDLL
jgi:hypothetical protein